MHIRMRVTLPGTRNGRPWPGQGETCDVPDDEAEQLIRYGAAELAESAELAPVAKPPPSEEPKPTRKTRQT
ncbi:hypothetical protein ACFXGT_11635 [Streptomyces sp. NPDC059352]|uniref:hypothetical protein n=1 Tax=Streptomyces sp. NPDC059352 TaxID=3346810 RepID=UPI0036C30A66